MSRFWASRGEGPGGSSVSGHNKIALALPGVVTRQQRSSSREDQQGGAQQLGNYSSAVVLRVTSPTITTPLAGVPEPFLASHYMKCLCPVGGALVGVELVE